MSLAIFSSDGLLLFLRWMHFFFGIIWIGLLYYFNFVQGAFFAETDAATKSNATQKLVPRALWWFRWGAMYTVLAGLLILLIRGLRDGWGIYGTSWGVAILIGFGFGICMWFNVWFVIWPAQKVVIESAKRAAAGGQAIPEAAARGARSTVASRTNTMFSIPLLFFMGMASHLPLNISPTVNYGVVFGVLGALILALEINALKGKTGPFTTIKGVISCGFGLSVVFYVLLELLTK